MQEGLTRLNEPMPPVKKSSKEILQEIKQLYKAGKYDEALILCSDLVARHPNNADLKGLYAKIEARTNALKSSPKPEAPPPESTVYYTDRAETAMSGEASVNVDQLIQQGVKLYEVQDYEQAMNTWERALAVDPDNTIAMEYLGNVRAMVSDCDHPASVSAEGAADEIPDKNQLLTIYNEGLQLYKHKDFDAALEKWEYILKYHPGHKETQECIRKTRAALDKEQEYVDLLDDAESDFRSGDHAEAERKVLHLLIKAPHLEGAQKLKESIEERKRQITEIRSLEIEDTQSQHISSATDDEITRYFTPEAGEGRKSEARKVIKIVKQKKERKIPKWLPIAVVVLIALGVGGYFGWQQYQRQLVLDQADVPLQVILQEDVWDSPERSAEEFASIGTDYMDEGEFLFAMFAFEQAQNIANPKVEEINKTNAKLDESTQGRLVRLKAVIEQASGEIDRLPDRIVTKEVKPEELKTLDKSIADGDLGKASDLLMTALSMDPKNEAYRNTLKGIQTKLALEKVATGELDEAHAFFRRAAVLTSANSTLMHHVQVINLFYDGSITPVDKDQWFFFFLM